MADDSGLDQIRMPPHSIEAEQAVLGGLLLDNSAWDRIAGVVYEHDFYREDHRRIFAAIIAQVEATRPADVLTVAEYLRQHGALEAMGGMAYLAMLAQNTPSAANIRRYADIVRERSLMRTLAQVGTEIADSAYSPAGRDARTLLDEAESKVFKIAEQGARTETGLVQLQPVLTQVVERIDMLYARDNPDDVTGVPTGFADLDSMTSGLQPGDLVIVAGRPSMGKTAFSLNIAEHVGLDKGLPVAVFSMEMGATQLAMRLLGSVGHLDQHRMRTGRLEKDDWQRLTTALGRLSDAPIYIDETPALNPLDLRARARRLHRQYDALGLVVVDYLQLMTVAGGSNENRATEISEISRSLKALAKELKVPVVALSQLNRSLEQRPNKRPVMSDLRECVTGGTLVTLADGRRVPIARLVGTTPEVLSITTDGRIEPAVSDCVWPVGRKPVFRVSLASGRTICCTAEHRLRGLNDWKQVGTLTPGDRLAIARSVPGPAEPSRWQAHFAFAPTRSTFAGYAGILGDQSLAAQARNDLFWDTVVAVEPVGEDEVYDLTVPGNACWLADGIVSHNSGAIEQDADLILFIYRDEVYNPESPDKGTAEIIIGKQRNGPIGTVRLTFMGQHTRFQNFAGGTRFSPDSY